jgi:hypothetical protein
MNADGVLPRPGDNLRKKIFGIVFVEVPSNDSYLQKDFLDSLIRHFR